MTNSSNSSYAGGTYGHARPGLTSAATGSPAARIQGFCSSAAPSEQGWGKRAGHRVPRGPGAQGLTSCHPCQPGKPCVSLKQGQGLSSLCFLSRSDIEGVCTKAPPAFSCVTENESEASESSPGPPLPGLRGASPRSFREGGPVPVS